MKRIFLIVGIVVGLVLIALAASPFWLGMQAESSFNETIQTLATRGGMPVKNAVFSRGWLGSDAKNDFTLPGAPVVIGATHQIEHGPLPLSGLASGDLAPALALVRTKLILRPGKDSPAEVSAVLRNFPPIEIITKLDLSGNGSSEIMLAGGSRKQNKELIKWSAASGNILFDKGLKKIKADLALPSLSYQSSTGTLQLKNLSFNSDTYEGVGGYMFGRNSFGIVQISMKPFFEIGDVSISAFVQPRGKFAAIKVNQSLKKLVLAKDVYGPGKLNISISKLDAATLKRFEDELNKIYGRSLPQEQMQMMVAGKMMEFAGKLTRNNPEIEITKLSFAAPGGELQGKAKFVVQGKDQDLSANPMLILTAIKGWAELTMPESLAKAIVMPQIQRDLALLQREGRLSSKEASRLTPETIDQIANEAYPRYLTESGFGRWFVPDEAGYKFSLSVSRGQVVVNGVPLSANGR